MTLRSHLKKAVAAVAAAASLFAVGVSTANALQDGGKDLSTENGAIYIHKRATTTKSTVEGTGKVQAAAGQGLNGVEFVVYTLDIDKVEGQTSTPAALTAADLASVNSKAKADELAAEYGGTSSTIVRTTNQPYLNEDGVEQSAEDGVAKFPVIANGYYLIVENGKDANGDPAEGINVVDGVKYDVAAATVVAMPYVSGTDGNYTYLTNVNIYPKNVQSEEPGKVKKTQLTSQDVDSVTVNPDQLLSNGSVVAYDLKLVFNRDDAAKTDTYIAQEPITDAKIVDNLPTAEVPMNNGSGVETKSVFNLGDANPKVSLIKSDGSLEEADASLYTFANGLTADPTLTWTLTTAGVAKVNLKTDGNAYDYKGVQVRVTLTANAELQYASSVVNKSSGTVNAKEQEGDKVESPVAGLNLVKTNSAEEASTDWLRLQGAKFQLSKVYDSNKTTAIGSSNKINSEQLSGTNGVLAFGDLANIGGLQQSDTPNGEFIAGNATIADFAKDVANRGKTKYFKFYAYETGAPAGYQLREFPVAVVLAVSVAQETGKVTVTQEDVNVYTGTGKGAATGETNDAVRVINYKPGEEKNPFRLPNTGGVGTVLLTLAGVALIVFAVVFLRRRRNEEER